MATAINQNSLGEITGNVLFYKKPEPLAPELHGKMGVKSIDGPFNFAKIGHAVPLTVTEFALYGVCGPVIFVGDDKIPLAVMGLNGGENMFITESGVFEAGVYVPAYVRRYPFIYANDATAGQLVLCIDREAEFVVEGGDLSFFDDKGQPTEYTQNCIAFCNDYEAERQRTVSFINLLKELDLFEVKEANHIPVDAEGNAMPAQKIADYFAVSEDKLKALSPEKLAELRDNGALQQIYAHLFSLVNWDRLIAMALSRANQAAQAG